ncbi:MAG: JAB domain-containing protein [Alistipes sp.]|nr:JAB domain-containing protein [Alistipes sp.]
MLYLNTSNRIIDRTRISQGGVSHTVVDARIIVKRAIEKLAHGMILVHNHPSGNPEPSPEDQVLTQKLQQAAALFDILLMDHLIVTAGPCYSFRNHGFFDKA